MSQRTIARLGLAALVLAAAVAVTAVAGVRLGLMPYAQGWQLMIPATGLGLVALGLGLAWLTRALKANDGSGRRAGLAAVAGAALLLYAPVTTYFHRLTSPPIHDFTTDTENPPGFVMLAKLRGANANPAAYQGSTPVVFEGKTVTLSEVLHDHYRDILKPHAGFAVGSKDPIATFFWRNFETVKHTGWTVIAYDEKQARIEATTASFWFGRVSDIVIQVRRAGTGARTDLRVQSRDDAIDDGANAALAKRYFRLLAR
jgi:hypothetical protein